MRSARRDRSHNALPHALEVTVRRATDGDAAALVRLAALDSANVLLGPVLVAEVGGSPMAAISLTDGRVIADPFERTADLVELLRVRASQSRAPAQRDGRRVALARGEAGAAQSIANQT